MTGLGHFFRNRMRLTRFRSASNTAPWGQIRPQAPQSKHNCSITRCALLRNPDMAPTGHTLVHTAQPMHLSVMKNAISRPLLRADRVGRFVRPIRAVASNPASWFRCRWSGRHWPRPPLAAVPGSGHS